MRRLQPPADPADPIAIEAAAVRLLASREHARAELQRKLEGKGFQAEAIAPVLDDLEARDLLSDARFAEAFLRDRVARGQGPVKIAMALRERDVNAMDAMQDYDWQALAAEVRQRRFGSGLPQAWPEKAKQMRFLQGRGFSMEQIRAAVDD